MRGQLLRDGQPTDEGLTPEIVRQLEVVIDGQGFVPATDLAASQATLRVALNEQQRIQRASDNAHHALLGATVRAEAVEDRLEQIRGLLGQQEQPATESSPPSQATATEQPQPASRPRWARLLNYFWVLVLGVVVGGAVIPNIQDGPTLTADPIPESTKSTTPTATGAPIQALNFSWAGVEGATGYHIEFHKDGAMVMERDTREPRFVAALSAGEYRWFVWSVTGDGQRSSKATVASLYVAP